MVSIQSPEDGAIVKGIVTISVKSDDNVGVNRIEFYVDDEFIGEDSEVPYLWDWDSSTYSLESHTIRAIAYDEAGNSTSDTITVIINSGPTAPQIIEPNGGELIDKSYTIMWQAAIDDDQTESELFYEIEYTQNEFTATDFTLANGIIQHDMVNDVFLYDTAIDSDGGAWRNDVNAESTSWYVEPASATRGEKREFPETAYLIVTDSGLDIIDARDNSLWMRFLHSSGTSSEGENATIIMQTEYILTSVFALNGKIYVSYRNGQWNGLTTIDFINDIAMGYCGENIANSNIYLFNGTIAQRNQELEYGPIISPESIINSNVHDVHAALINDKTFVAVATDGGVSVINENDNTLIHLASDIGNDWDFTKVFILNDGSLYYGLSDESAPLNGGLAVKYDIDQITSHQPWNTARDYYYWSGSIPYLGIYDVTNNNDSPNDIFVTKGTSIVSPSDNTIYLATDYGVAVIQEYKGLETSGKANYYSHLDSNTQNLDAYTTLILYMDGNDIIDSSASAHTVMKHGDVAKSDLESISGGYSVYFDGDGDYLSIPDSDDFDFGTEDFTIDVWVNVDNFNKWRIIAASTWTSSTNDWTFDIAGNTGHVRFGYFDSSGIHDYVYSSRNLTAGQWHTLVRDLQQDLADVEPGVIILEVNGFYIRGSGRVDDIKLLSVLSGGRFPSLDTQTPILSKEPSP